MPLKSNVLPMRNHSEVLADWAFHLVANQYLHAYVWTADASY